MDSKRKYSIALIINANILAINALKLKQKRQTSKRRVWVKKYLLARSTHGEYSKNLIPLLLAEYNVASYEYENLLRMNAQQFEHLLEMVGPLIQKKDTVMRASIPAKERLILTLRHLASGEPQNSLRFHFKIAQSTISGIITETVEAILFVLYEKCMIFPKNEDEWQRIADDYEDLWGFPHTLGSVDGKHVAYLAPANAGSAYINYKGFNSIVIMAIVDAHYRFIYADVGANGVLGDATIFNRSNIRNLLENGQLNLPKPNVIRGTQITAPYIFLADDAFGLTPYMLKPFSNRNLTQEEIDFNYLLSRNRRMVECAFGIIAAKFQILMKPINVEADKAINMVMALICLHNWLRTEKMKLRSNSVDTEDIDFSYLTHSSIENLRKAHGGSVAREAENVRNIFKNYISETGLQCILLKCKNKK